MRYKLVSMGILFIIILALIPPAESQQYYERKPQLYFSSNISGDYSLEFERPEDWNHNRDEINIRSNEIITLSITGIEGRVYDPDLDMGISISRHISSSLPATFDFQFRCDGDGDGEFEYIVDYDDITYQQERYPYFTISEIHGEPSDMNFGTIEFIINRTDDNPGAFIIFCLSSFINVPFDLDIDSDGIGAYSDPDNDNDGHEDRYDAFPNDPKEWQDTDSDGIGDNSDPDFNGNGILDSHELPLAMGVLLIPVVVIFIQLNRIKKKRSKSSKEDKKETNSKTGPKNQ